MSIRTTKITKAYLADNDACEEQVELFASTFPEGVEVTEELAINHAGTFDWLWAIEHLLEGDHRHEANSAEHVAYRERQDARWKINDTYGEKSEHTAEEVQARIDAIGETQKEYRRKLATIFARAFLAQGGRALTESEGADGRTLTITSAYLDHRYACPSQMRKFVELFPKGVTVTTELAIKHAEVFDFSWAIFTLLEGEYKGAAKEALYAAEEHYRLTIRPAYDLYWADMNNIIKRGNYERIDEAARKNLNIELAGVFAHYFTKQGGRPLLSGESSC